MAEPQVWGFPKEVAQRLVKSLDGQPGGTVAHPKPRYFEDSPLQPILLRNDSAESMPAYGIGLVTGFASVNGAECLAVTKPTTTSGTFVVNGPTAIAATGNGNNCGHGFRGPIVKVKYYSSDNPTIGQIYGVSGWTIRSTGSTLTRARIIGQIDTTEKTCFAELLPSTSTERRAFGCWGEYPLSGSAGFFTAINRTNTATSITTGYGWHYLTLKGDLPLLNDNDALRVSEQLYLHGVAEIHLEISYTQVTSVVIDFWTLTNADTHRLAKDRNGQYSNWWTQTFASSTSGTTRIVLREEFWTLATTQSWYKAMLHVQGLVPTSSNVIFVRPAFYTLHLEEITAEQYGTTIASSGTTGSSPSNFGTGELLTTGTNSASGTGTVVV